MKVRWIGWAIVLIGVSGFVSVLALVQAGEDIKSPAIGLGGAAAVAVALVGGFIASLRQ